MSYNTPYNKGEYDKYPRPEEDTVSPEKPTIHSELYSLRDRTGDQLSVIIDLLRDILRALE